MKTTVTREIVTEGKNTLRGIKKKKVPSEKDLLVQVRKDLDARWWKIKIF